MLCLDFIQGYVFKLLLAGDSLIFKTILCCNVGLNVCCRCCPHSICIVLSQLPLLQHGSNCNIQVSSCRRAFQVSALHVARLGLNDGAQLWIFQTFFQNKHFFINHIRGLHYKGLDIPSSIPLITQGFSSHPYMMKELRLPLDFSSTLFKTIFVLTPAQRKNNKTFPKKRQLLS